MTKSSSCEVGERGIRFADNYMHEKARPLRKILEAARQPDPTARPDTRSGCVGTLRTQVVHGGHRLAEVGQPVIGVLADETHAPGERIGA